MDSYFHIRSISIIYANWIVLRWVIHRVHGISTLLLAPNWNYLFFFFINNRWKSKYRYKRYVNSKRYQIPSNKLIYTSMYSTCISTLKSFCWTSWCYITLFVFCVWLLRTTDRTARSHDNTRDFPRTWGELKTVTWTHCSLNKMAAILQETFSHVFVVNKVFWMYLDSNITDLLRSVQLIMSKFWRM